jgi:hypothetical protein
MLHISKSCNTPIPFADGRQVMEVLQVNSIDVSVTFVIEYGAANQEQQKVFMHLSL